jgi:putative peptidoglycan lipid II flippase
VIEPPEERVTAEQSAAARMTLAAIIISAFGLLGKILGYGKEILIAAYWGRGAAVDAFVVVYKTIVFELYVKIEKLLRPTYLPIFVARKSEGDDDRAWRYFSVISTFVFVFMTPLVLAAIIWAPGLIRTLFPGLEMVDLAADMLRISGAATLLMVLSVMTELTLHSHKEFTIPALADATRQFVLFGTIGALIGFGIYPSQENLKG